MTGENGDESRTTVCCPSSRSTRSLGSAFSPIAAGNTADSVSTTSTNCIWHRRTSTTAGPRRAASKDQRHLRALPPHHSGRVLRDGLSQEALHQLEGTADGSRCLARRAIGHVRTQASTVTARLRCRPSWTRFLWRGRKCLTVTFPPRRSRSGALHSGARAEARPACTAR